MLDSRSCPLMAHTSFPSLPDLSRRQHLSRLSLTVAIGGEAGPSPGPGYYRCPSPPPSLGLAGEPWVGRNKTCAKRLGPSARLRGHCPSIPPCLRWSECRPLLAALPPLPKSSLSARAGSSLLFLLSHPSLGRRDQLRGGDRWASLSVMKIHVFSLPLQVF